jgi:hypothetical protein
MNETEFAKVEKIANQLKGIVSEEFVSTTLVEAL